MRHHAMTFLFAFLAGCSCQGTNPDATAGKLDSHEGDDPGECTDGADNDRNSFFDCKDQGCWGSPDCDGYGTGPGTGGGGTGAGTGGGGTATGSGTGTGGCAESLCELDSAFVEVHMEFDFNDFAEMLGLCDCYLDYEGTTGAFSQLDTSTDVRLEFIDGSWERVGPLPTYGTGTGSGTGTGTGTVTGGFFQACVPGAPLEPCKDFIANGVWAGNGALVYHSFFFGSGDPPVVLEHWFVHEYPDGYEAQPSPINAHQFYVTDLYAPYDHNVAAPTASMTIVEQDPGGQFDAITEFTVTFQK